MIREPFAIGNSIIHRLDPRFRIVIAAIYSIVLALSKEFPVLISGLAVSMVLAFLARLNAWDVIKRLAVVFWFLLLIWCLLPLTFNGDPLYHFGRIGITKAGMELSAQVTFKSIAILMAFMALAATMSAVTLGHALSRLLVPEKLVHLLLMTHRYIFVMEQEYKRLWTAVKIRGFRSGTNVHSYKTYAYLVGMLFVRASLRADRVNQAMRCRGFTGKFYSFEEFIPSIANWIFAALMSIVMVCLILMELK